MLSQFKKAIVETSQAKIKILTAGKGFPLLLLHGYPQTSYMWHKIAPRLAADFSVVMADLRGYGDSSKPKGEPDHSNYSKRIMARDQMEVMSQLGYQEFYLVGHDRGARVAHRLTLDYPEKVKKMAILDIIPTYELYKTTDKDFATAYYHWFFLIQPYPLPETLIGGNPEFFLRQKLQSLGRKNDAFTPEAFKEYLRCFSNPATIHATCEDYRAAASIDLIDDELDLNQKLTCPVLVLWGKKGLIGRKYNVVEIWQKRAIAVSTKAIDCGHFLAEEAPEETYLSIREFLSDR
jgi:haloacetate dehalogenase